MTLDSIAGKYTMTTCKHPEHQENSTPLPSYLQKRGRQDWSLNQSKIPVVSPTKRGMGNSYLYLLQKSIQSKSSGFTIIECLLAIIMVSIMLTAVAPVIVLSVATRVQARRVEQAAIAGRNYIDAVQSGKIPPPTNVRLLEEVNATTQAFTSKRDSFSQVAAPSSTLPSCLDDGTQITLTDGTQIPRYPYCSYTPRRPTVATLYCVDNDGNGGCTASSNKDYIVQAFRSVVSLELDSSGDGTLKDKGTGGYVLGVRVYRADGFDGATPLQTTRENNGKKVATYTGGKGNQFAPLAEFTTEVRPGVISPGVTPLSQNSGAAMKSLCDRLGGCTNSTTTPTP
jgi:type II secretory pathway pseudopilin PulG